MEKNLNNKNLKDSLNPHENKIYGLLVSGSFSKQLIDRLKLKETFQGRKRNFKCDS